MAKKTATRPPAPTVDPTEFWATISKIEDLLYRFQSVRSQLHVAQEFAERVVEDMDDAAEMQDLGVTLRAIHASLDQTTAELYPALEGLFEIYRKAFVPK